MNNRPGFRPSASEDINFSSRVRGKLRALLFGASTLSVSACGGDLFADKCIPTLSNNWCEPEPYDPCEFGGTDPAFDPCPDSGFAPDVSDTEEGSMDFTSTAGDDEILSLTSSSETGDYDFTSSSSTGGSGEMEGDTTSSTGDDEGGTDLYIIPEQGDIAQ